MRLHGIRPELVLACSIAEGIWNALGAPLIITAGTEGQHTAASDHYSGCAVDFRTKNLAPGQADVALTKLQAALGDDFFLLHELVGQPGEHVHCSWRPKAAY